MQRISVSRQREAGCCLQHLNRFKPFVWFCCMLLSMAMVEVDGQIYERAWITSTAPASTPLKFISICLAAPECTVEHTLDSRATRRNASTLTEAFNTFPGYTDVLFLNGLPELGIDRCSNTNCAATASGAGHQFCCCVVWLRQAWLGIHIPLRLPFGLGGNRRKCPSCCGGRLPASRSLVALLLRWFPKSRKPRRRFGYALWQ